MKFRLFALAAMACVLLNALGFAADGKRKPVVKPQVSRLISLLPASDAVAVFDAKRFLTEALPKLLSANQPMLKEITGGLTDMESRTGIDLRKFDQVAVGLTVKTLGENDFNFGHVLIASGDINAGALLSVAKLASGGKYREEKIGNASVYVFTVKDAVQTATTNNSKVASVIDKSVKELSTEIAVTSLDRNTLAIGTLDRVRETVEAKTHLGTDLTNLLSTKETAVMSFAAKMPAGMSKMLSLDNDELGANIDAIQYMSGSMDVAPVGTSLQMMARTAKPDQALVLKDTLEALQLVGKAVLGSSKKPNNAIYGRMVRNAKFDVRGTDVTFELLVPQADIDTLVAAIKSK